MMLVLSILFMNGGAFGIQTMARTMGYENRLFDKTKVHTVDIVMEDWEEFIADAASEEYEAAEIVIDGEAYKNVGLRAKGNTSLSTVASLDSERYSFKIEFDHYDSAKSYYGLDKISLNNLIQDSTMMKDYLAYTMMNEFGVNSPLCSYVYITVNGEDWGLYLAVEGVEEAFLERNYGSDYGELYKPDSMSFGGGRGNGMDFDMEEMDFSKLPEASDQTAMFGGGGENGGFSFGGGMGSSDVKLQYVDDDLDSYSNIWDNAKTDITRTDQERLVESLKKLSDNEDIASVVDIEQVLRYFVVHNYICNDDSYTGMMVHNYYLYEKDGKLSMLPWDYNLGFGTFGGGNATSTVNTPIDSPVSGGSSDRPMLNWIFENEEYTEQYHQYFGEFLGEVDIQGIINQAYELIRPYVEKDPTAFFTYEEFEQGMDTLRRFCELRSESISVQLENGETTENGNYVDASDITLSDMGSMAGGGFDGGMPESMPGQMPEGMSDQMSEDMPSQMSEGMSENMPFDMSDMPFNMADLPEGQDTAETEDTTESEDTTEAARSNRLQGEDKQIPDREFSFGRSGENAPASELTGWIWIAVSAGILMTGLIVAKKYKR